MSEYKDIVTRIRFSEEHVKYLESSARMRGVSLQGLIRRVMYLVARDQLVLGIADGDDLREINDGLSVKEHVPRDRVFDSVRKNPIVTGIEDMGPVAKRRGRPPGTVKTKRPAERPAPTPKRRQGGSVPIVRTHRVYVSAPKHHNTRSEMARMLAEAVRNTAAMPVPEEELSE